MTWWSLAWTASPLWLVINALTAYRLTRLWVVDKLPPLPRLRDAVEEWADRRWAEADIWERAHDQAKRDHWLRYDGRPPITYLVSCVWCSGYWISLAVFLLATLFPVTVWAFVAVPLAFSAVAGLLHQATE